MKRDNVVPVITLDGPSGTGKGTICHMLARHLGWHVLDSGSIYRALAYAAKKRQISFDNQPKLVELAHSLKLHFESDFEQKGRVILDEEDVSNEIRTEQCGQDASKLAALPEIREALLERQRAFAQEPGLVTDGRDMGTIVFPEAALKLYLYASEEERALRRYYQLKESGIDASLAVVVDELAKRDARDKERLHAPLKPASDSLMIDTTGLTILQVFNDVLKLVDSRFR